MIDCVANGDSCEMRSWTTRCEPCSNEYYSKGESDIPDCVGRRSEAVRVRLDDENVSARF